jgi:hypothetical protein
MAADPRIRSVRLSRVGCGRRAAFSKGMHMLRKLVMLVAVIALTCVLGLVIRPTSAFAAGGFGVGPSQTGATGAARACEATAANHGLSYANGIQCVYGTPSLVFSIDQSTCTLTLAGSGLIPGSVVIFWSEADQMYVGPYYVDSNGNLLVTLPGGSGFSDTLTPYAFTDPTASTPYFTGPAFSFTC